MAGDSTGDDQVYERSATVRDGRAVAWTEWGPTHPVPVLRVPGTPGSRWTIRGDRSPWAERQLRVLTTERPGYGASTRLPGRGFAEHADDLAEILDAASIDRTFVIGGSGAAPHILAFLAQHPDRVRAATIQAGAAPLHPDEVGEMIPLNQQSYQLGRANDRTALTELLIPLRAAVLADPLAGFRSTMAEAPPEDHEVMNDPVWQRAFVRAITESLAPGVDGWADESLAITRDWDDIDLAAVTPSVTWWHTEADHNAPVGSARRLVAQLPNARFNLWPDGGHFAAYHREREVLDELLSRG
jgi:pimeloyl-ACP methyl ester carboxylesterase